MNLFTMMSRLLEDGRSPKIQVEVTPGRGGTYVLHFKELIPWDNEIQFLGEDENLNFRLKRFYYNRNSAYGDFMQRTRVVGIDRKRSLSRSTLIIKVSDATRNS